MTKKRPCKVKAFSVWSQQRGCWWTDDRGIVSLMSEGEAKGWSNPPRSVPMEVLITPVRRVKRAEVRES